MAKRIIIYVLIILYSTLPVAIFAMSSATYSIIDDSINTGGTEGSASENYKISDSVGGIATGYGASETYRLYAGFRVPDTPSKLSFSLSGNTINLGTLSLSQVKEGAIDATVTTNASAGYTITVVADGHFRQAQNSSYIQDISAGSITSGVESYGLTTSGTDGQYNGIDTAVTTSAKTVASNAESVTAQAVNVDFKAAIGPNTAAGDYSHVVTFVCTGNF